MKLASRFDHHYQVGRKPYIKKYPKDRRLVLGRWKLALQFNRNHRAKNYLRLGFLYHTPCPGERIYAEWGY